MRPIRSTLALALAAALAIGCKHRPDGPNILLITLDTTRRDHLGMYGYPIPTSPHLDALAKDSLVYTNAYATSSWTLPTHASMFTGKLPSAHGANYDPDGPLNLGNAIGEQYGNYRARPIAENETTLAQLLGEHGYATGGVIAGPWLKKVFRLGKGFEEYDDEGVTALNGRPAEDVTARAIEFVDRHAGDPFFLFLNYYDAHSPWWKPGPKDEQGNETRPGPPFHDPRPVFPPGVDPTKVDGLGYAKICYDAEIHHMDGAIGDLIEHLKQRGLYENTWIFVLADHGDLIGDPVLGETGLWGHGDSLTEAEIHIPFLVKEPGAAARKGLDATPVQQIDLLPTILTRLKMGLPPDIQGTPLDGKHPIVAELYKLPMMNHPPKDWRHLGNWRVLVEGPNKYGWSSNGTPFLVDLTADPGERTNLESSKPDLATRMCSELDACIQRLPRPGATGAVEDIPRDVQEQLNGLGYTGSKEKGAGTGGDQKDDAKKDHKKDAEKPSPEQKSSADEARGVESAPKER